MKLKIEKLPHAVRLECAHDTGKKPIAVELTTAQVEMLVAMLATAAKADKFKFEVEV